MKVLWIVNVELPDIALEFGRSVNIEGWLNVTSTQLAARPDIELHVACRCYGEAYSRYKIKDVYYYSFSKSLYSRLEEIIIDVNPDLIHIWGTECEHSFVAACILEKLGLIEHTVVSMQGLVSVIGKFHYITGLPPKVVYARTIAEFFFRSIYLNIADAQRNMIRQGEKELLILQKNKNCIGRTNFDYACIRQINPHIKYFRCNETLREGFYNNRWNIQKCKKRTVFFSQSHYPVKGVHIFIEALAIIKRKYPDVQVRIVGKNIFEKKSIKDKLVNRSYQKYLRKLIIQYDLRDCIEWLGQQTEEEMIEQYCHSNVFVSASLIENSSNSIGEAMLLGMPIVASDVGGIKSLLEHNKEGILYQETAPYMLADGVIRIFENDDLACQLGENAYKRACITHDREENINNLLGVYKSIAREGRCNEQ